ncbi:UNVERIFIED_ORG: hypothetical protein ABIB52_003358 [Arthrobacter sp. UYCu721]
MPSRSVKYQCPPESSVAPSLANGEPNFALRAAPAGHSPDAHERAHPSTAVTRGQNGLIRYVWLKLDCCALLYRKAAEQIVAGEWNAEV